MKPLNQRLFDAIGRGDLDAVRKALDDGADVKVRDGNSWGPLDHASGDGLTDIVRLLLERGADLNANNNDFRITPLHWACHYPKTSASDTVRLLLEAGADLTARNSFGKTPLDQVLSLLPDDLLPDDPAREEILNLFRDRAPELVLESVLKLPPEDPLREKTLEWYREHHPEMLMDRYVAGPGAP